MANTDRQNNLPVFQQLDRVAQNPYSQWEYLRRFAWSLVNFLFIKTSLPRAFAWRRFWLQRFGATLDPTCRTRPSTHIVHPWLLTMGPHSTIGDRVRVYNLGPISIGSHSVVSQNAHLCAGTHDYTKSNLPLTRAPITIGHGVWICADAFIGPNVTINNNSMVAARAVVTKEVPPGVIVAGNPAQIVKSRKITS